MSSYASVFKPFDKCGKSARCQKKTTIPTEKEKKASNVLCVYGSSVTAKGLLVLKVSNRMFIQTSTRRKAKELYH